MGRPLRVVIEGADGSGKDAVIAAALPLLKEAKVNVQYIRSTEPIEGNEPSQQARAVLVAPQSSPQDRFLAALYLYQTNVSGATPPPNTDVQLIYRGWSGFYVYNKIPFLTREAQFELIPDVDAAIMITAEFDTLTKRINARNEGREADFQDSDLEYRRKVYEEYNNSFVDLGLIREKSHMIVMNEDGRLEYSVRSVVRFITSLVKAAQFKEELQ